LLGTIFTKFFGTIFARVLVCWEILFKLAF
jgi:hypothetical protein